MPSRLLKNYCGGSSAALRGVGSGRFALRSLRSRKLSPKLRFSFARATLRNPHVRPCTRRFLRSVRLASDHPRYVFQRPARALHGWLRGQAAARGFTLIELLAAISILSIVAVLSWRGLDTIIRTRTALTSTLEQTRGMQLAFAQMQSDCGHIVSTDEIGKRPTLLAESGRLTLVRTVFIENQPSRLQVVAYRLRDSAVSRHESEATRDLRVLDALWSAAISDAGTGTPVVLQTGVADMNLKLWDATTGWYSTEAVAPSTAATTSVVPTGLEVNLRLLGSETGLVKVMLLGAL